MLNKIKDILSTIIDILFVPFFIIFLVLKDIKSWILCMFTKETTQAKSEFLKSLAENGGNTHYKIECPECGYSEKNMIGGGHTFDNGCFSSDLVYCPDCKEPLIKSSVHYLKKSDGENQVNNNVCPKCGKKTVEYDIKKSKIKLKCPKCAAQRLKITNLYEYWIT